MITNIIIFTIILTIAILIFVSIDINNLLTTKSLGLSNVTEITEDKSELETIIDCFNICGHPRNWVLSHLDDINYIIFNSNKKTEIKTFTVDTEPIFELVTIYFTYKEKGKKYYYKKMYVNILSEYYHKK